jgi:integrase
MGDQKRGRGMSNQRLSDTWLRLNNNKKHDKEIIKSDGDGLAARLRNGKITFLLRPTLKTGQRIKMTIGNYPTMTLKAAREKVAALRAIIQTGHDPRKLVSEKIEENISERTLNDVFNYWLKHYARVERSDPDHCEQGYKDYLGNVFGKYYYKQISRQMFISHLLQKKAMAPSRTGRVLGEIKQAIEYCINHDYLQQPNTLADVTAKTIGIRRSKGQRVLKDLEILRLFENMNKHNVNRRNQLVIELLLLTGCRSGELRQTKLSWLDFKNGIWSVPWQYHKTGSIDNRPLVRPIIQEWRPLFEELIEISSDGDNLLTNLQKLPGSKKAVPMTVGAMLHGPVSILRTITNNAYKSGEKPEIASFSNHDLRRTARTNWSNFGSWAVCEKMLGHALPGESDVYDHNQYIDEMIAVYKKWTWRVSEIRGLKNNVNKLVSIR